MPTASGCPDPRLLEQLLLGQLSGEQARELEDHVRRCPACGQSMQTLPGREAIAETVDPDAVRILKQQLKRLCGKETMAHRGGETGGPGAGLDFLDPPRGEGEIGWLGPFRVLRLLGSGGMGVVFLADDPRLKRQVAIKLIKPEMLRREGMHARFLREAENVAKVEHENIVAIHEINEQRGVPYLVMPLLRGESLEDHLLHANEALPAVEVVRVGKEIASGLAAAHSRGLIHRDIKPANIFLCAEESPGRPRRVKVLDFGLAGALAEQEEGTESGIVGTPAYMPPEQAEGKAPDARADLFSLGCVLYRAATGRPPFDGPDVYSVLIRVATEQPEPIGKINPKLPGELVRLIERLMAKKPDERPASADEVVAVLTRIEESRLSRRRWLFVAAGGALAAAGLGAWLLAPRQKPVKPGEVTLVLGEPATKLVLVHGEEDEPVEIDGLLKRTLPPGDYLLRLSNRESLRQVVPERFVVAPGERLTLPLRLVGEVRRKHDHAGIVYAVAFAAASAEPLVISCGGDRTVVVWDGRSEEKSPAFRHHEGEVYAVAVSPDGRLAASGGGGKSRRADLSIRLWDVRTREQRAQLQGSESDVQALAFSADGLRLVSGQRDGIVTVWDVRKGTAIRTIEANDNLGVHGAAWLGEKQLLTAGGDGKVRLWDLTSGKPLAALEGHKDVVRSVAVHGEQVVTAGIDGTVRLWELTSKRPRVLRGHQKAVYRAIFTPDGRRVLSAGADGVILLWDVGTGEEVWRFKGHRGTVHGLACAADGRRAASGGQDGTVRLWELPR